MTIKKNTGLLASLLAAVLLSAAAGSAEARHGGGGGGHWGGGGGHWGGGGGHWGGGHFGGLGVRSHGFAAPRHFRHRNHGSFFAVAPFYYSDYGYADGCYWLRRRALYTGSGYWWNRYYACVNGY
jgi:hypothetical protein